MPHRPPPGLPPSRNSGYGGADVRDATRTQRGRPTPVMGLLVRQWADEEDHDVATAVAAAAAAVGKAHKEHAGVDEDRLGGSSDGQNLQPLLAAEPVHTCT